MVDVEAGLGHLGHPGCFHIIVFICLGLNNLVVVMNHLAMVVYAPKTPHKCHMSDDWLNATTADGSVVTPGQCSVFVNRSVSGNFSEHQACQAQWDYEVQAGAQNIIMQFNLVCQRHYLIHLSTTIYFCGVMLGGVIFGTLADLYGRKPFLLLTQFLQIGIGVCMAFASNYQLFIVLRFVQGIIMQGLQTTSVVLIMELFPRRYSAIVGSGFEVFWALGVMWLALVAYLIQNWQYIQLAIALPSLLTVFYIWLIPESIRWLVQQKNYSKAEKVLAKAARFNRVTLPADPLKLKANRICTAAVPGVDQVENGARGTLLVVEGKDVDSPPKKVPSCSRHSLLDMFRTAELRKRSLIQFYIWFVVTATYYGLSLRLSSFAGNKYLNVFYGGLCELPVYCAASFILARFGRKGPLVFYLLVGGSTGVTAGVMSKIFSNIPSLSYLAWLPTTMAVLSRVNMAGCFSIIWLYCSELYPTVIRNSSLGACTFWMRVGAMVAPQILQLGDVTYEFLPLIIFGSLCLVGGLLTLLLPETKSLELPETMDDIKGGVHMASGENGETPSQNGVVTRDVAVELMANGSVRSDEDEDDCPEVHEQLLQSHA